MSTKNMHMIGYSSYSDKFTIRILYNSSYKSIYNISSLYSYGSVISLHRVQKTL